MLPHLEFGGYRPDYFHPSREIETQRFNDIPIWREHYRDSVLKYSPAPKIDAEIAEQIHHYLFRLVTSNGNRIKSIYDLPDCAEKSYIMGKVYYDPKFYYLSREAGSRTRMENTPIRAMLGMNPFPRAQQPLY